MAIDHAVLCPVPYPSRRTGVYVNENTVDQYASRGNGVLSLPKDDFCKPPGAFAHPKLSALGGERDADPRAEPVPRAKKSTYILVVCSRQEIEGILKHLSYPYKLVAQLQYGCGLRIFEGVKLRVKNGAGPRGYQDDDDLPPLCSEQGRERADEPAGFMKRGSVPLVPLH